MNALLANERRDKATVKIACGVYLNPTHWAGNTIHSFARWVGETTLLTWCGLTADISESARQTTDLITCVQCSQASWRALRDGSVW